MNKELKYDWLYMDIATRLGDMSYAVRKQVGAIAVRDGKILAEGWNGMPSGMDNTCEYTVRGELITNPEVLHAESNLFAKIAKSTESSNESTVYCTLAPCLICAKMMYQAGVTRVVYLEDYRDTAGRDFLTGLGVSVTHLEK